MFATRNGKPLSDGNLLKRLIYPACDRLGILRLGWHALRHLHSTLLSQLGVHRLSLDMQIRGSPFQSIRT